MMQEEDWFNNQTKDILNIGSKSENKEDIEYFEEKRHWVKERTEKGLITPFFDEESESEKPIKEFAYSDVNPYKSERVIKRIDRELREAIKNETIAKENEKTTLFWLFSFLFGKNENKDIVKKYKKEERERKKRVRICKQRQDKLIQDKTKIKDWNWIEERKAKDNLVKIAGHNTTKRKLKQIEVMKLQENARKKAHKILRKLKSENINESYLKSLTIYITDILSDCEPYEINEILVDLQKDAFNASERKEVVESETEKLMRYMEYSNRLFDLREYGISYKNLIAKDKREVKEMRKEREVGI